MVVIIRILYYLFVEMLYLELQVLRELISFQIPVLYCIARMIGWEQVLTHRDIWLTMLAVI